MRVLIADRNARLLESISRTLAHQFSIQTASSREHCEDLLRQGAFDLVIVGEKLADGPGLQLLGQTAQSSPDMLRIFAARRSRLQLLKGRLGPFGLFRTLSYPIDAQNLLSALVLARAAREIDPPTSTPGPATVRRTVKRFSLISADTLLSINVPMTIASRRRIRPSESSSESSRVPQLAPVARQAAGISSGVPSVRPEYKAEQSALPLPTLPAGDVTAAAAPVAKSAAPRRLPSQSEAFERALARREAARRAGNSQVASRPSRRGRKLAHPTHRPRPAGVAPKRSMVLLGATIVAVFLVATLALNRFDAAAGPTRATSTSSIGKPLVISRPSQNSTPASPTPFVPPAQSVAQRTEPKPASLDPQMAASSTPIADPSSFGHEAYQAIYSN